MVRRASFLVPLLFALLLLAPLAPALAQGDEATQPAEPPPDIVVTKIDDRFYKLSSDEPLQTTVLLHLGDDSALLVDSHWSFQQPHIREAIAGITDLPVRYLINTHWHPDHVDGNAAFRQDGTQVFSHHRARERMAAGQLIEMFGIEVPPYPEEALPQVTFDGELALHVNGQRVQALFTAPAHTDGDVVVFFPDANIVQMGDVLLKGWYPLVDASSDGSYEGMVAVLERVLEVTDDDTVVVPGHGPLATRQDLVAQRDLLATMLERMTEAVDAGLTLEQALEQVSTAEWDDHLGQPPVTREVFLTLLYQEVAGR